jgi:chemotaxis protein methyltransferase CheR
MSIFDPQDLGIVTTGLPLVRDLIHERMGLYYDDKRYDALGERLAPLVLDRGFQSFLDYYYLLKYDENDSATEWRRVMDALSVQETYFWREVDQIRALACSVMPEIVRAARGEPIRIWSAPCATGEEPLTIAMMLSENGWFDRADIEIHGSDGSTAAIARAKEGRYRERSFRALPPELREKYFTADGNALRPTRELARRMTSWTVVNLMARDEVAPLARGPVVFCRNAFIYFSPQSVRRVVNLFADLMASPAFLFVGASESLLKVTDRFSLEEVGGAFAYVRRS